MIEAGSCCVDYQKYKWEGRCQWEGGSRSPGEDLGLQGMSGENCQCGCDFASAVTVNRTLSAYKTLSARNCQLLLLTIGACALVVWAEVLGHFSWGGEVIKLCWVIRQSPESQRTN